MSNDAYILKHYKKVAENFGPSALSTIQDPYIREAEEYFFISQVKQFLKNSKVKTPILADFGCGNGHMLYVLRKTFPTLKLIGLEFTPELFEIAKERNIEECQLFLGDIRKELPITEKIDIVITERVIINLLSWKQQQAAFINIRNLLKHNGLYFMSESFRESWCLMNQARKEFLLDEIPQSKHNRYISENAILAMEKMGLSEIEGVVPKNYLSTHFYMSRIFHQIMRPEGGRIKRSHFVDFFNKALPPAIGNYSPIQFRVFKLVNSKN